MPSFHRKKNRKGPTWKASPKASDAKRKEGDETDENDSAPKASRRESDDKHEEGDAPENKMARKKASTKEKDENYSEGNGEDENAPGDSGGPREPGEPGESGVSGEKSLSDQSDENNGDSNGDDAEAERHVLKPKRKPKHERSGAPKRVKQPLSPGEIDDKYEGDAAEDKVATIRTQLHE